MDKPVLTDYLQSMNLLARVNKTTAKLTQTRLNPLTVAQRNRNYASTASGGTPITTDFQAVMAIMMPRNWNNTFGGMHAGDLL